MLKIRVKGKHLVALCLSLLLVAGGFYVTVPSLLYKMASSAKEEARREAYYNYLINSFPNSSEGIRALFFSAQQDIPTASDGEEPGLVYIFPSSTGMSGGDFDRQRIQEAIDKFLLVRERAPESPWSTHALYELGKAYFALGDYVKAEEYLKQSIDQTNMEASGSTAILIEMYLMQERYGEAIDLAERTLEEKPGFNPLEMLILKGKALMALQKWDAAIEVFRQLPVKAEAIYSESLADAGPEAVKMNVQEYDKIAAAYLKRLEGLSRGDQEVGSLRGQVTINGQPAGGVRVYLIDKSLNEDYYTGSSRGLPKVITNKAGEYTFEGLAPGQYALGIGVRGEDIEGFTLQRRREDIPVEAGQSARIDLRFVPTVKLEAPLAEDEVDGKVTFRWQSVPGAVRYEVFMGPVTRDDSGNISANYTSALEPKLTGGPIVKNQAVIDLAKMQIPLKMHGGIAYSDGVNPESILGLFRPGGVYTWGVYAYDDKGNKISDSAGMMLFDKKEIPLFRVAGEPSGADQLLLDKKYEAAIKAYKEVLRHKPNDIHALLVLARLNQYGVRYDEKNLKEAVKYYEKLLQVKKASEGKDAMAEVKDVLAGVYFDMGRYQKAEEFYKATLGTSAESWHTHFQLAKIKFLSGQPKEALSIMESAVQLEGGQYARAYPVALALVLGDPQKAVALAQEVDEGQDYVKLLQRYAKEYKINNDVKKLIWQGEYEKAKSRLTDKNQHDIFTKGLLEYLINAPGRERTDKLAKLSQQLSDKLLAELLNSMGDK